MTNRKKAISRKTVASTPKKKIIKPKIKPNAKKEVTRKKVTKTNVKLMDFSYLKRSPFKHQLEAADFLLTMKKAILADDMGAGKTFSTILALHSIKGKKIIVCPASLKLNWKKEIRLVSNAEVNIIEGKKWIKPSRDSWTIINYDILGNHLENIKKGNFLAVAFDEVHYCKSVNSKGRADSKRARYFLQISNQMEFSFLLTGTPISNKTKDIFNLLKAVKHPLSKKFKEFAQRYCAPEFNGFGWSYEGSSNQEELNKEIQPYMLRRLKSELLELPEKTRSFIPVDIDKKVYEEKVDEYVQKRGSFNNRGQHLMYLNAMRHNLAKEKVPHTIKLAENLIEQNKPVVIFTNYTFVVEEFKKRFKQAVTITGANKKEERNEAVEKFQKGDTNIIICNLVAGGVGLTLTNAKNMLINDFDWTPSNHLQAEERIYRIGQTRDVVIEYVYGEGTFDEKMADMLEEKIININKIIDDNEEGFLDGVIGWFE